MTALTDAEKRLDEVLDIAWKRWMGRGEKATEHDETYTDAWNILAEVRQAQGLVTKLSNKIPRKGIS